MWTQGYQPYDGVPRLTGGPVKTAIGGVVPGGRLRYRGQVKDLHVSLHPISYDRDSIRYDDGVWGLRAETLPRDRRKRSVWDSLNLATWKDR